MKYGICFLIGMIVFLSLPLRALAGVYELGGSYSYTKSTYNAGSYTWTQKWSGSIGYYFTEDSELEFMYQDSTSKAFTSGYQDITYHDRVYSVNLSYFLFESEAAFRPYFRGGAGQLNRDVTGSYAAGYSPPGRLDEVTVILGAGVKAKLSRIFALKIDADSYLAGGGISTWRDNITLSIGGSFYF